MKKYENHKNVVILKKAYAELTHNYKMFHTENPGLDEENDNDRRSFRIRFADYLQERGYEEAVHNQTAKWIPIESLNQKGKTQMCIRSMEYLKSTGAGTITAFMPPSKSYYLALYGPGFIVTKQHDTLIFV